MNINELIFNIEEDNRSNTDKVLEYASCINHLKNLKRNLGFDPHPDINICNINHFVLQQANVAMDYLIEQFMFKLEQLVKK